MGIHGFNHYERHHLENYIYSKTYIDTELSKKADHADIDTKIDTVNDYHIHCLFNKEIENQKILFYGSMSELLILMDMIVKEVILYVQETDQNTPTEQYSIVFNNISSQSETSTQIQSFILPPNTMFLKNQLVNCIILNSQGLTTNIKKAYLIVRFQKFI